MNQHFVSLPFLLTTFLAGFLPGLLPQPLRAQDNPHSESAQSKASQAQTPTVPKLSQEEKDILSRIRTQDVQGILSFLASDELKGRDTPSAELNIAAAYVASRFRAAGLEGLGPKGSYFLESELDARMMPGLGILALDGNGNPIPHYGLVSATENPYEWNGALTLEDGEVPEGGPILLDAPAKLRGRMARMPVGALVPMASSKARDNKASAVLLRVPKDHGLVALAAKARKQPLSQRTLAPSRGRGKRPAPLSILLVPEDIQIEGPVRLYFPAYIAKKVKVRNVAAILRGRNATAAKKAVAFTAHLDHIGTGSPVQGDGIFNGADDDATGCTAVMLLARAYGALARPPLHSTIFMTYWGEEKGLVGSRHFADHPAWPLDDLICNINIEMIGRATGNRLGASWVTGWSKTDLGPLIALGAKRAGLIVREDPRLSKMLYRQSDNWSLAKKGVIAHSFSASGLHKDYHGRGDEWQKVDAKNMALVIRGLFAGSLPIAMGRLIPSKN